jgi:hypothetical protein
MQHFLDKQMSEVTSTRKTQGIMEFLQVLVYCDLLAYDILTVVCKLGTARSHNPEDRVQTFTDWKYQDHTKWVLAYSKPRNVTKKNI